MVETDPELHSIIEGEKGRQRDTLALIASVLVDPSRSAHLEAVVTVPEAQVRAADSINAPLRFGQSLPEGAEVRILEDRGGWLHIELQNGRDGWLTQNQVRRVAQKES